MPGVRRAPPDLLGKMEDSAMADQEPADVGDVRIRPENVKSRLESGESAIALDVRGWKAWESSDLKIRNALRADPERFRADPSWPRDRLLVVY